MGKQADPFYGTEAWQRARSEALRRDLDCCVWCRRAGRYAIDRQGRRVTIKATLVHHIKPLKEHPELALSLSNLVSLCDSCHDEAHPEKHMGKKREKPPTAAQLLGVKFEQL